ncbi:TetR/AcrR family transcriptional regulator [Streptomyces sclerotialus]|uniref:TetR/AcrR family transcriptional regulator n=1 Tax=Streptomyces sclerotialus TaxID=1957 RepID=UPI0004CA7CFC
MSPRGVAITDVRERLFDAAERVLLRDGPGGLTNRAITGEAGCAKGLLYHHFSDLDDFTAQLCLHHFERAAARATAVLGRPGAATVTENVTAAAHALLGTSGPRIAALALTRAPVTERVRAAMRDGAPGLGTVEEALTAYIEAEQALGRVARGTDSAALALAVVGTTHHLLMTGWTSAPDPGERVSALVEALLGNVAPGGA